MGSGHWHGRDRVFTGHFFDPKRHFMCTVLKIYNLAAPFKADIFR